MTTIADLNDKWAAYAGPGGWNGIFLFLVIVLFLKARVLVWESSHSPSYITFGRS